MIDKPLETLLEEKELAETLQVSIGTLRTWRTDGKGPRFHRIGQMIRYAPSDVKVWLLSRQAGGGGAMTAPVTIHELLPTERAFVAAMQQLGFGRFEYLQTARV